MRTLEEIKEAGHLGAICVGSGGSEEDYPTRLFEGVFVWARQLESHTSAHAGEAAGPGSVWGAIRALHADRIGHGTRAADERLLDYLAAQSILAGMCPPSNLRTGVVRSYESHPEREFFERRIRISINTDDPRSSEICWQGSAR